MSSYSPPTEAPSPRHPGVTAAGVEIRQAGKVYRGFQGQPVRAIEDATLTIERGEIVSLIGPSGCGKSTLLMLIAGLDKPTSGEVLVNGRPVVGPSRDVGVVFQRDLLLDWRDVIGNVLSPFSMAGERSAPHRDRARELLAQVGLAGFEKRRPYELSGGMRQRVALCRGLIQDPEVILLDEPFAALDSLTREQMQLDVQRLWSGQDKTAVLVTHDIAEAVFMSDRIVVMSSRPSRIHTIVDVNLPRPRTPEVRESKEFAACHARVHHLFKDLGVLQ
jgi:NitT/TauT family transport system ATP-binding protein